MWMIRACLAATRGMGWNTNPWLRPLLAAAFSPPHPAPSPAGPAAAGRRGQVLPARVPIPSAAVATPAPWPSQPIAYGCGGLPGGGLGSPHLLDRAQCPIYQHPIQARASMLNQRTLYPWPGGVLYALLNHFPTIQQRTGWAISRLAISLRGGFDGPVLRDGVQHTGLKDAMYP